MSMWRRSKVIFSGRYLDFADIPNTSIPPPRILKPIRSRLEDWQLLLPSIIATMKGRITLIDFGGGNACAMNDLLESNPDFDLSAINYILIETDQMCKVLASTGLGKHIEILSSIPFADYGTSIVNICSSLQYVDDWRMALRKLSDLRPVYILLTNTAVVDGPTYACAQLNNPPYRIPRWMFNEAEIRDFIEGMGYKCSLTVDHNTSYPQRGGEPSKLMSMIFKDESARQQSQAGS